MSKCTVCGYDDKGTGDSAHACVAMNTKDNQEAMQAIKELIDNQQPLPADMAKVLYDNLWSLYEDSATLTTPQVNEEVASGEAYAYEVVTSSGYYKLVYPIDFKTGLENEENITECLYKHPPTPSQSNVLVEALQFIKNGNCATLQGAIIHASQTLATHSASTDGVTISTIEYEALKLDAERYRFVSKYAVGHGYLPHKVAMRLKDNRCTMTEFHEAIDTARKHYD